MSDVFEANRRFERFLFLTPHESEDEEDELIAIITYDFENKTVTVRRADSDDILTI